MYSLKTAAYAGLLTNVVQTVPKGWGFEIWVANSPLYCGKILHILAGKKFSWHYHQLKDETFFCLEGQATAYYHTIDCMVNGKFDRSLAFAMNLAPGVALHIPPGLRHQVVADADTFLMEVSTEHFDSDSIRLEAGD